MTVHGNTMEHKTPSPLTDDELFALVDHQLSPAEQADVQARLGQDPQAQAQLLRWQHQRERLRARYQSVLSEPIPSSLLAAAENVQQTMSQRGRWGGMAATVLLSFGIGWVAHTAWQDQSHTARMARTAPAPDFVRQASYAYAVYAPEVRHPVEVVAAEQDHLVQWLSKRLGKTLKVPSLSAQGYELVGGRLLPGETGARAQFMFQNSEGTRVTLYLGALDPMKAGMDTPTTAFQFTTQGALASFYWVDQGFGYALTGAMPRPALMQLATAVYPQL